MHVLRVTTIRYPISLSPSKNLQMATRIQVFFFSPRIAGY
jgi:hypothetical protein